MKNWWSLFCESIYKQVEFPLIQLFLDSHNDWYMTTMTENLHRRQ